MTNEASKILAQSNAVSILIALSESKDPMTMTELWGNVGSGYNAIKNETMRLVNAQLAVIEKTKAVQHISLTPEGILVAKHLKAAADEYQKFLDLQKNS